MNQVKVKICGIRNIESAEAAAGAGADFLGFNFVEGFRRSITSELASQIIKSLNPENRPKLVGVFLEQSIEFIKNITNQLPLDYVQLHGNETPEFCSRVGLPIIKAFSLEADFNVDETLKLMKSYNVDIYLVDRLKRGTGEPLNLKKVSELTKHFKIMLAGGLNPENVSESVQAAHPFAVDVAGGIETNGEPDLKRLLILFLKPGKVRPNNISANKTGP